MSTSVRRSSALVTVATVAPAHRGLYPATNRRDHILTSYDCRPRRVSWLAEDPEAIAERYRSGKLDALDLIRQYGVIVDWGTGTLLRRTTEKYRELLQRRAVHHWRRRRR